MNPCLLKWIGWSDLQTVVWLVQQLLSTYRKAKNLTVVQSVRLVFGIQWNPKETGSNTREGMSQQQDRID